MLCKKQTTKGGRLLAAFAASGLPAVLCFYLYKFILLQKCIYRQ